MAALAEIPKSSVAVGSPSWVQGFANLDGGKKLRLAVGLVLGVAIAVVGLMAGRQADYRV